MKRYFLSSLVTFGLLTSSAALAAQGVCLAGSSVMRLNPAAVERALHKAQFGGVRYWGISVPVTPGLIPARRLVVTPVLITKQTPVTDTLVKMAKFHVSVFEPLEFTSPEIARIVAHDWLKTPGQFPAGNKVFYTDPSTLARDLNAFYSGKAIHYVTPGKREVKIFALPINGILYQPAGYEVPVVLNSHQYFVLYDLKADVGQVLENTPAVYEQLVPFFH